MYMLGKKPAVYDERTLHLEDYLNIPKLPPLPDTSDWFAKVSKFSMAGNDTYGDCVVAGAAHMIQTWSANAGREVLLPDKKIIDTYFHLTGGSDDGLNMLEFLKFWRKTGIAGHKIGVFAAIDPKNITSVRYANYLFGGVYFGFMLQQAQLDQFDGGLTWDYVPGSKFVGGHCVNGGVATPRLARVGTWGKEQWVTVQAVGQLCDEAYAIISLEWFDKSHHTPSGFHWAELVADLKAVTN